MTLTITTFETNGTMSEERYGKRRKSTTEGLVQDRKKSRYSCRPDERIVKT
jgi:hypothetical protein